MREKEVSKRFSKSSYIFSFYTTIHEQMVNRIRCNSVVNTSTHPPIFKKATNQSKNYIINFNLAVPSTAPPTPPPTTGE